MITLLAESKTMSSAQEPISEQEFLNHQPVFEQQAGSIMQNMEYLSPAELASVLGISNQLAIKAHNLAYDFPHKVTGYKAIYGFTGEAYRGLDITTLPITVVENARNKLRIISSVYGVLRPDDIIKPYRCEFNKPVSSDHKTPIQIYKPKITIEFVKYIKENKIKDIINLLPADADKCLDWKIIRAFASVHKIVFQVMSSDGKLKTPIASRLKELRGLMCRTILQEGIDSFEQLKNFNSPHFIFSAEESRPLLPVFIAE